MISASFMFFKIMNPIKQTRIRALKNVTLAKRENGIYKITKNYKTGKLTIENKSK